LTARDGVSSHFGEGIAVDGTLLAAWEPEASAVVVFDLRQERPAHVTTFGSPGRRVHEIGRITAIAADEASERIWIVDEGNDRIVEWTLRRDPTEELRFDPFMAGVTRAIDFGALGRAVAVLDRGGERVEPMALSKAPGEVLVLDRARRRVIRLDDRTLEPIGLLPSADMGFPRRPMAMAVSADGRRVALLDGDDPTRLAAIIPLESAGADGAGGDARIVPRPPVVDRPKAIAWAGDDAVVVTTGDDRLVIVTLDGRVMAAPEMHGVDDGMLWHPRGVASASDGSFFIVDWGNHRLQRFESTGLWHSRFGIGRSALRPRLPDAVPAVILPKRGSERPVRSPPATSHGPFPRACGGGDRQPALKWWPVDEHGATLEEIPLRDPFFMRVSIASQDPATAPATESTSATAAAARSSGEFTIGVDAAMPHHGHGMNLAPSTRAIEGSADRIVGPMLFHMPGAWEIYFDLATQGRTIRIQDEVIVEQES